MAVLEKQPLRVGLLKKVRANLGRRYLRRNRKHRRQRFVCVEQTVVQIGDCLARNFRRKLQDFRSVALQRSQRRRLLLRAARVSIRSSCCSERRRQWRLDENKIRIRMNEATGEIKDVNVDAKAELAPRKKLER